MANDLNRDLANARHAWQLRAETHAAAAEKIRAAGPRKTAGPVSREMHHMNLDAWLDKIDPHELRAQRYSDRVAAADKGHVLDHGTDAEAAEFRAENVGIYNDAARAQRIKFLKPGQAFTVPGSDR